MSYIGNQPTTTAFLTDTFSANGSGTVFTLSAAPANTNSIIVAVSGVLQDPSTYSVSGTALTFSAAPPAGTGNISVRFLGIPASGVTTTAYRTVTEFTATAGQTTFTPPSYTVGYINVYRNGALLGTADYTASNGTTVVLASAASSGDLVVVESFYVSSVLNAIPAQNNAVINSYILSMAGSKLTGTQSIPKATLPTGSVLQVVQATKTDAVALACTSQWVAIPGQGGSGTFNATITPSSASSKILVFVDLHAGASSGQVTRSQLRRDSTVIYAGDAAGSRPLGFGQLYPNGGTVEIGSMSVKFLDSPTTTSALTYTVYAGTDDASGIAYINRSSRDGDVGGGYDTRTASSIILMEIAA